MGYLQVGASSGGFNSKATYRTKVYVLSDDNISSKSLLLDFVPSDVTALILVPAGGTKQNYGTDYIVQDGYINWDGLGLDGVFSSGETIFVYY